MNRGIRKQYSMKRIYSIDFTRGLVMIIMALDHVRDLMHIHAGVQNPTSMATTTPMLFFTRWATHLCAPIFVFLAGTSVYLALKSKGDISLSRKFLVKRGLWLIVLDFTIVNFGLFFDPGFNTLIFEVLSAIGVGFIILSLLLTLPPKTIGIIGLAIIFLHDLVFLIPMGQTSIVLTIFSPFFSMAAFPLFSNHVLMIAYPPVPWLGIMLAGFAAGKFFELAAETRKRIFIRIGAGAILLFVIVRFINIYGDPAPWSVQRTPVYTFLSFMNVTKYPPSLSFCLVMLGIMFLILGFAEGLKNKFTDIAYTYGKVPLFYFVIHFYIIHVLLLILLFTQGFHWTDLNFATGAFGRPKAPNGLPLWGVYLVWAGVVAAMYKPCTWYGRYKATHKYWWLGYI